MIKAPLWLKEENVYIPAILGFCLTLVLKEYHVILLTAR